MPQKKKKLRRNSFKSVWDALTRPITAVAKYPSDFHQWYLENRHNAAKKLEEKRLLPISEIEYLSLSVGTRERVEEIKSQFERQFNHLDENRAKELSEQTRDMIKFIQSRAGDWARDRASALRVALGAFAFSTGLLLAISSKKVEIPTIILSFAIPFLTILTFTSFRLFLSVSRQIGMWYPFIGISTTWRWFYLYNVPSGMIIKSNYTETQKEQARIAYLEGMVTYAKKTIELDATSEIKQDLEQLYLLLIYEGYQDEFAMKSNRILSNGMAIGFFAGLLGVLVFLIAINYGQDRFVTFVNEGVAIIARVLGLT